MQIEFTQISARPRGILNEQINSICQAKRTLCCARSAAKFSFATTTDIHPSTPTPPLEPGRCCPCLLLLSFSVCQSVYATVSVVLLFTIEATHLFLFHFWLVLAGECNDNHYYYYNYRSYFRHILIDVRYHQMLGKQRDGWSNERGWY